MDPGSRGNPRIAPTAHFTAQVWHRAGFAYADLFDTWTGRLGYEAARSMLASLRLWSSPAGHGLDFLRLRHQWMEQRLRALKPALVFEIGAGLSSRGLALAVEQPQITYVELDLPAVVASKRRYLGAVSCPPNYRLQALDLLAEDFGPRAAALADTPCQPCVVVSEGVCDYLDFADKNRAWRHIAALLRAAGGGHYLLEVHPRTALRAFGPSAGAILELLACITGGDFEQRLFANVDDALDTLMRCGFDAVTVVDPASLSPGSFPVPERGRFFELLEARVEPPPGQ